MDGYLIILCLGFGGLLVTSLLGLGHFGHAAKGHGSQGHASMHHHQPAARARGLQAKSSRSTGGAHWPLLLAGLLSPILIFSLLLGFGAAGILLKPFSAHWSLFLLPLAAAAAAVLFERYLVQPLRRLLFGFASTPAKTLESLVLEEGHAVTNFDASGHGLIVVDLDGQVRQLLGNLTPEELATGRRVVSGDRLFIRAVDPRRNSCTVSRLV